jgi:hypothetical protein
VLDTVRSASGSRSAPITDHSIVTLPNGMETSVSNAVRMGYLRRTGGGGYESTALGAETTQHPQQAPGAPAGTTPATPASEVPIHPDTVIVIDKLAASVPVGLMGAAVNAAINGQSVRDIGEASTLGSDEFTKGVEHVVASLQAHASHVLGRRGIDGADFAAWASEKHPREFREAQRLHFESGNAAAYDALATRYERITVADPRGTHPTRTVNGQLEVFIEEAGWLSLRVAKNAGLL